MDFGSLHFKRHFDIGQAVYELHCTECGIIIPNGHMAEAALKLIFNLALEDQDFLELTIDEVSDTENGTGVQITQPLR